MVESARAAITGALAGPAGASKSIAPTSHVHAGIDQDDLYSNSRNKDGRQKVAVV